MSSSAGAEPSRRVEVRRFQDVLPAVRLTVDGVDCTFLLDTGAGVTCIAPALAASLGREPWGRLSGLRMGGERIDFPQVDAPRLVLCGLDLRPRAVGVVDLAAFLPGGWPPVDGVLALDAFHGIPFTLDLRHRTLVLEGADGMGARPADAAEIDARVARPVQGVGCELFLRAHAGDHALWLEVDSCNAAPVLLATHTHVEFDADGATEIELELAPGIVWRGDALAQDLIIDGNLGQTFLVDHALTVDLGAERTWVSASR